MPQPSAHQDQGSDDLPSYEEMIVEALQESTDSEGCAPKDLFAWMAARYPLQSNFRPSASQALQKAFKRGRFEKSSNGKYRLSATWEGGSVRVLFFSVCMLYGVDGFCIVDFETDNKAPTDAIAVAAECYGTPISFPLYTCPSCTSPSSP